MLESAKSISSAIQNISAITAASAAGTEQVSASMNEGISSIQKMAEEAETMNNAVFRLQNDQHFQIFKLATLYILYTRF